MTYVKQTWTDGSAGGTPLSAARLAHIEDGVEAVDLATAAEATARASGDTANATALTTHKTSSDHDARYVRKVNGVGPDGSGNVSVSGGSGSLPPSVISTDGFADIAGGVVLPCETADNWTVNGTSANQSTTLSAGIDASVLSFTVASSTNLPSTGPFVLVLESERVLCDSRSGTTVTVNAAGRGYDNTVAAVHASGASVLYNTLRKDTVVFAAGAASVVATLKISSSSSYMNVNLASAVPTNGRNHLTFQFRHDKVSGAQLTTDQVLRVKVADANDLGGTVVVRTFPALTENAWSTVTVDVSGLTQVKSFRITTDAGTLDNAGRSFQIRVDDIRLAARTGLDAAVVAAQVAAPSTVLVSPQYGSAVTQEFYQVPAGVDLLDLRDGYGNISVFRGERHVYDWVGVDGTGLTEQSAAFSEIIDSLQDGDKLVFAPGATYWWDAMITATGLRAVTLDWNGAQVITRRFRGDLFGSNSNPDNILKFDTCKNVTMLRPKVYGYREKVTAGSAMTNYAGTPVVAGGAKTLTAQGDAVRPPNTSQGFQSFYARYPLVMFPAATRTLIAAYDPTFTSGNAWTFTLSDSNAVASDCVIELLAWDDPTVVLASRTLTLNATPTDYVMTYVPKEIHRNFYVNVRKATATTNTITVGSVTEYGFTDYVSSHDSASAFTCTDTTGLRIRDLYSEGIATDPVDFSDSNSGDIFIDGYFARCSHRQGGSFNRGVGFSLVNFEIGESGRSGFDVEPFAKDWVSRDVTIRGGRIYNSNNYAFALANWANIENLTIEAEVYGTGVGLFSGGAKGGRIRIVGKTGWNRGPFASPSTPTASINGQGMHVTLVTDGSIEVGTTNRVFLPYNPAAVTSTVTGTITAAQTTFALNSITGFPTSGQFKVILNQKEVLLVTGGQGTTTWTVSRAQDGTSALDTSGDPNPNVSYEVALVENFYPDDNVVDVVFTKPGDAIRGTSGRRNEIAARHPVQGSVITSSTANIGQDTRGHDGTARPNRMFPFSHGFRSATRAPIVPGGTDLMSTALMGVRGLGGGALTVGSLLTSSSRTTDFTGPTLQLPALGLSGTVRFAVTSASGSALALDVTVEVSRNGTNWYTATTLPRIKGEDYRFVDVLYLEPYVRLSGKMYGVSPSFTCEADLAYSVPGSNLALRGTCLSGQTSAAVALTNPNNQPGYSSTTISATTGGTLALGTYYLRIGARTRLHGPKTWDAEKTVTLTGSQNAINIRINSWFNSRKLGRAIGGFAAMIGTSSGVYSERYDVTPMTGIDAYAARHNISDWPYIGGSILPFASFTGFPVTYPTQSPILTPGDESGRELDTNYKVLVTPSWDTRWWVVPSELAADSIPVHFSTAPGADSTFDVMVVR